VSTGRGSAARGATAAFAGGVAVVAHAWLLAASAILVGIVGGLDWSRVLRLVITALVYAPVAAVILTRRHAALAVILSALAMMSAMLALTMMIDGLPSAPAATDGVVAVTAVVARLAETAAIGIMPWLLVRGAPRRRALGVVLGSAALVIDLVSTTAGALVEQVPRWILIAPLVLSLVSLVLAGLVLAAQWRRGDPRERQAIGWFGAGAALLVVSYLRLAVDLPALAAVVSDAAFVVAQGLLPTAVLAVVLGGRELGRDRRLVDGIVLVQSLAFAVSLYLLVDLAGRLTGLPSPVAGGFAAGALALAFSALSGAVRRRTSRLYFGTDADARAVLRRLGERIAKAPSSERAVADIAASLREAWGVRSVAIASAAEIAPVVVGERGAARVVAALVAGGRQVGEIELTGDDEAVLRRTVAPVLAEIAPLIAVTVLLAAVNEEVSATRRRTLGIRREERRILHRELHDDLAPSLAGIGFGIAAARRLVGARSDEGPGAVAELRLQVAARADDVRRLARTLLPTALDAGDLDAALRELAQRFGGGGVAVESSAIGADVLEPPIQVGVYLAATEAVGRLRRARGVRRIAIDVGIEIDRVRLVVESDAVLDDDEWDAMVRSTVRRLEEVAAGRRAVASAADEADGLRRLVAVMPR